MYFSLYLTITLILVSLTVDTYPLCIFHLFSCNCIPSFIYSELSTVFNFCVTHVNINPFIMFLIIYYQLCIVFIYDFIHLILSIWGSCTPNTDHLYRYKFCHLMFRKYIPYLFLLHYMHYLFILLALLYTH